MIALGFGEILGAPLFGYVQDKFGNKITSAVCMFMTTLSIISCVVFTAMSEFNFGIACVMCFAMGF